jgi:hypothetical protein
MKRLLLTMLIAGGAVITAPAATLTLANSGALFGAPDEIVGWSFTIESTPVQDGAQLITPWLLVTAVDFIPNAGVFPVGVFAPYLTLFPNSSTVIGPDTGAGELNPFSQTFSVALQTGIGAYHINDFQSAGDQVIGQIVVYYDSYRVSPLDPAFDPSTDTLAVGEALFADASVTVGESVVSGIAGLALVLRSRRRNLV